MIFGIAVLSAVFLFEDEWSAMRTRHQRVVHHHGDATAIVFYNFDMGGTRIIATYFFISEENLRHGMRVLKLCSTKKYRLVWCSKYKSARGEKIEGKNLFF